MTLTKTIVNQLLHKFQWLNEQTYDTINSGGCGVFALYAYDFFVRNGFKDLSIVVYANRYKFSVAREIVRNNDDFPENVHNHLVVRVGRYYVDCKNISMNTDDFRDDDRPIDGVTREQLAKWLTYPDQWNRTFDRTTFEPRIKKFFEELKFPQTIAKHEKVSVN